MGGIRKKWEINRKKEDKAKKIDRNEREQEIWEDNGKKWEV